MQARQDILSQSRQINRHCGKEPLSIPVAVPADRVEDCYPAQFFDDTAGS